jgi:hypothetical protein
MKRILAILFVILMITLPVFGQDDSTAVPTDEPAATLEAAATAEPTEEAVSGVVINNTTTTAPAPAENNTVVLVLALMNLAQMGIILAQAIMNNGSVSKKTVDAFFAGLKGLAKTTAWDGDEKLVDAGEKVTYALLGERIVPESPTTPGGISPQG